MSEMPLSSGQRDKGGELLPALFNIVGTFILLAVIASCLPIVVPQLMGYQVYNVVSGSMEPEIPVGSVIYVQEAAPETIEEGEVIAFRSEDSVIAHRVVKNQRVEGEIRTKGDANAGEDMHAIAYYAVLGRVVKHYPMLGAVMEIYTSTVGKVYLILFASCGAMMNLLASRIRENRRERKSA